MSLQTIKQYGVTYKKWWEFCTTSHLDPFTYDIAEVIKFLNIEASKGKSYSAVNCHKAAFSLVFDITPQEQHLFKRYMKGVFNKSPPKAKYEFTWDPHPVLKFLEALHPLETLSLKDLTSKAVTLLALVSAHRVQTLAKISIHNIKTFEDRLEILVPDKIKTTKLGNSQPLLIIPFFHENHNLCLARTLQYYIEKTSSFRPPGESQLLLTFKKPFHAATRQSVSRWIKSTLYRSGINTSIYTSHSTRHAATSAALRGGMQVDEIRKRAGWTEKSETFSKFYNRPLAEPKDGFYKAILQASNVI